MPTLLRKDGFKFFFYANEHLPKHIHVQRGDDFAKINIEDLTIIENYFSSSESKRIIAITKEHQQYFLEKWDEFFQS
jgi:hypothetical protein